MDEAVELPAGWRAAAPFGGAWAMTNETWSKAFADGWRVVRYSWQDNGYCLYHEVRAEMVRNSLAATSTWVRIEGTPAWYDDPIAAMIWAEVEYG